MVLDYAMLPMADFDANQVIALRIGF